MRILIINDNGVDVGGVETYLANLKKEIIKKGHEVRVMTSDYNPNSKKFFSDYTFKAVNPKSPFRLLPYMFNIDAYRELKDVLAEFKPDIVHLHFIFYHTSPSVLLLLKHIPTVMTIHAHEIIAPVGVNYSEKCNHPFVGYCLTCTGVAKYCPEKIKRIFFQIVSKNIKLYISPSIYYKKLHEKYGIKPIVQLFNGISESKTEGSITKVTNNNELLFIGRLAPEKGTALIIKAMEKILKKFPNAHLTIVGTGPEEKNLHILSSMNGYKKEISFAGNINNKDIAQYYTKAAIVIVPSNYPDNLPTVCIEAMKYGKPVVGADIGGIPELVVNNQTGLLFKPGDVEDLANKVISILKDNSLRVRLAANAKERFKIFSMDIHIDKLLKLYTKVIKSS